MSINPLFSRINLHNRLGQQVQLDVFQTSHHGRQYIFIDATQAALNLVAKNAEIFAFQLRNHFDLDSRRMELIELREQATGWSMLRWRFEWVGHSALSARSEEIVSAGQRTVLLSLIDPIVAASAANA